MSRDKQYQGLSDALRVQNDDAFGIKSYLNSNNEWVRDATRSIPLKWRMSHDAPMLYGNDALLRCISRLRPIDYAIEKKCGEVGETDPQLITLQERISELVADNALSDKEKNKAIDALEKEFNTHLVKKLHDAGLTKVCYTEHDAQELLFHYRNLSSVLEPARTMVTLTYDSVAHVLNRETQYPVTKKTDEQKKELEKLKLIDAYPTSTDKNAHTKQRLAMQEADALFAELMMADDTALPAQARKSHSATAKNAFIVKSEMIQIEGALPESDALEVWPVTDKDADVKWLARMGSPVFVGEGESADSLLLQTKENFDQVREKAQELMGKYALKLHVTTLNTYFAHEQQLTIIDNVYAATRHQLRPDDVSYIPVNTYGTLPIFSLDVAAGISTPAQEGAFLQKATRVQAAVDVTLQASDKNDTLSIVHCASGQDRTGTAVELTLEEWTKQWYGSKDPKLDTDNIQEARIRGGNAAEIASHLVPGSTGLKTVSLANNKFGDEKKSFTPDAEREIYRKSAKTNKDPNVGPVDFLETANTKEYDAKLEKLVKYLSGSSVDQKAPLMMRAFEVVYTVEAIKSTSPTKAKTIDELTTVLDATHKALIGSPDSTKTSKNAERLAHISEHTLGHASPKWKALGMALAFFACAVLVVGGVLATIPTGGIGLLLAIAAGGGAMALFNSQKGLARSVANFKSELLKTEPEKTQQAQAQAQAQEKDNGIKGDKNSASLRQIKP